MKRLVNYIIFLGLLIGSCNPYSNSNQRSSLVDFSKLDSINQSKARIDTTPQLRVAVSAMISPKETFVYYQDLFRYISEKIGYHIDFKQRKTYLEVNELLRNGEIDVAFICSGAYVEEKNISGIEILAVPICKGEPFYQAYIITNKHSSVQCFEDLRNKSFAFTDPLSNSGKLYAINQLEKINSNPDSYFSSTMYTYAHDVSMQLVSKKIVDGATIDGLIFDYLQEFRPAQVANLRIIKTSQKFGIPPIVTPSSINPSLKTKLENVFFSMHKDSIGQAILSKLLINEFQMGVDSNYNGIRKMKQSVDEE